MAAPKPPSFTAYHDDFDAIIGASPSISICAESADSTPLFHEACVFVAFESSSTLFVTSNRLRDSSGNDAIAITKVNLTSEPYTLDSVDVDIRMANGGVNYGSLGVLFCEQGDRERAGGIVHMSTMPPYHTRTLLSNFYGTPFNSVNDVVMAKDGAIWFTDPVYGSEQGFRGTPQLPAQVYRFDPESGSVRAMADGFGRPNGLAFSPDEGTLYVTDTDHIHGDGTTDPTRASSIYAFTIISTPSPTLIHRRLFAFASGRCPDGIKCDTLGNVYAGCLDGISLWNPQGDLLGKILIPGGVANFCFVKGAGEVLACGETRLWSIRLGEDVRGALLG